MNPINFVALFLILLLIISFAFIAGYSLGYRRISRRVLAILAQRQQHAPEQVDQPQVVSNQPTSAQQPTQATAREYRAPAPSTALTGRKRGQG